MSEKSLSERSDPPETTLRTSSSWEKVSPLVVALNPVLLLVIGYFLNAGIETTKAEIEKAKVEIQANSARLSDLKTAAETSTIALHERVDKVKVISDFLNDLSGTDERRRRLAIEAILIALPDEGTRLVKVIEQFNESGGQVSKGDVVAAQDALTGTRVRLVADMFSKAQPVRLNALSTLERAWLDDAVILDLLVMRAMQDVKARKETSWASPSDDQARQQLASVYNTAYFLSFVRVPADPAVKAKIREFLAAAEPNSNDTKRVVTEIKSRFE
jgi:hypothetical protein